MSISFNLYSSILWLGCLQAVIYTCLLIVRGWQQRRLADTFLALLLVQAGLILVPYMLGFMGIGLMWKELLFFPLDPGFLIGPTIFAYLLSQTNQEFRIQGRHLIHLLPFGLYLSYHLIIFMQGGAFVQNWLSEVHLPYIDGIERSSILISNIAYLYLSFRHYNQYRKWVETEFSNPEDIRLNWYRTYLIVMAFGIGLSWAFNLVQMMGHNLSYTQSWWEFAGIAALIYVLSINGFHQTQRVYVYFHAPDPEAEPESSSLLPDVEILPVKRELMALMTEKELFLQPQLSLREVAQIMGVSKALLSQVINQGFGKNFSQFVNAYRVAKFKEAVHKPENEHLSFLALALDSGFNSKATFNRVFKSTTGMSPREFVEKKEDENPFPAPSQLNNPSLAI